MLTERSYKYSLSNWLLGDHLGSTAMVANASGVMVSEVRYSAFGEIRYDSGTMTTDYLYTGQRQEAEIGLYYYVARWYDPAIGRFIQADSVVPDPMSAKGFDRYSYSWNNPLMYIDPNGHSPTILLDGEQLAYMDNSFTSYISTTASVPPLVKDSQDPFLEKEETQSELPKLDPPGAIPPPLPLTVDSDQGGYQEPDVVPFYDYGAGPILDFYEIYEHYTMYSKGGWKFSKIGNFSYRIGRGALPLGVAESIIEIVRQTSYDSYYHNELTFGQKAGRAVIVGAETLATDVFSSFTGGLGAGAGGAIGASLGGVGAGPGAAVGYAGGAIAGTAIGDIFWQKVINPVIFSSFPILGEYP